MNLFAIQRDMAAAWCFKARNHAQKRGLAATRAANKRNNLTCIDIKADLFQRLCAVGINFAKCINGQHVMRPSDACLAK